MSFRMRNLAAMVLGLWILSTTGLPGRGQELPPTNTDLLPPSPLPLEVKNEEKGTATVNQGLMIPNQELANNVAQVLKQSGKLQRYHVEISVLAGEVELSGQVSNSLQKEEVLQRVRAVPGVVGIRDRLQTYTPGAIIPVQAIPLPEQGPAPKRVEPNFPALPPSLPPPAGRAIPPPGTFPQEPLPVYQAPPNDPLLQAPPMPPYAWPTYAPYNNYSRVAYPTLYPYEAFPFIGPFYPFPKIPPGWRSVNLTWNDGFWWYGKGVTGHDWWRIRYR